MLLEDALYVAGSLSYIREGDRTSVLIRLTLGTGEPLVGAGHWCFSLDMAFLESIPL